MEISRHHGYAPEMWVSLRVGVGCALFVVYFTHFVFLWLCHIGKTNSETLEILKKRMHAFGIACLLSMNYLQASIFQLVFCWFTTILLVLLHMSTIPLSCILIQQNKNGFWLCYYLSQIIWYFGIIVNYYSL